MLPHLFYNPTHKLFLVHELDFKTNVMYCLNKSRPKMEKITGDWRILRNEEVHEETTRETLYG
jgi:hypothetical protein